MSLKITESVVRGVKQQKQANSNGAVSKCPSEVTTQLNLEFGHL
jgi:hypothetical protein